MHNLPVLPEDDGVPGDTIGLPMLQYSGMTEWSQVESWVKMLYSGDHALPAALLDSARLWKNKSPNDEARIASALHAVQNNIRYYGVEMGVNSHLPRPEVVQRQLPFALPYPYWNRVEAEVVFPPGTNMESFASVTSLRQTSDYTLSFRQNTEKNIWKLAGEFRTHRDQIAPAAIRKWIVDSREISKKLGGGFRFSHRKRSTQVKIK